VSAAAIRRLPAAIRRLPAAIRRLLSRDLGTAQVVIVLAVIAAVFASANDRFLTAVNLTNLTLQIAAVGTISIGVVLVLLLGEIDLSVGAVSGLCAALMAVLNVEHSVNAYVAMLAGLLAGTAIGCFQGSVATRLAIPSFVVTLAGLLAWQGVQLKVLGTAGTVNVTDRAITDLTATFLAPQVAWGLGAACVVAIVAARIRTRRQRLAARLDCEPVALLVAKVALAVVVVVAVVAVLNADRGVPLALVIVGGLVAAVNWLLTRTAAGAHIYAVGGDAEAARRAGISVTKVRVAVFMAASTFAAAGGILAASRLLAVNQSSGGSDLLLLAIAGPVIAGVSLFGGRGSAWSALLGALVIGAISNGMDLLALESSIKFIVTGGVLLAAVSLDALARNRRASG
jgi:D-xylose transport system permease protein